MNPALEVIIDTYTGTFETVLMQVLVVVVPASILFLVIKLSINYAMGYFGRFSGISMGSKSYDSLDFDDDVYHDYQLDKDYKGYKGTWSDYKSGYRRGTL